MKETKSNYCEHCGEFHDAAHEYISQVRVGEAVPDFEFEALQKDQIKAMTLSALRSKWVVLVFYSADFSLISESELMEYAKLQAKFKEANAEVIGISADTIYAHKAWRDTSEHIKKIQFPLAADPSGKIAYAFGVLIEGGEPILTPDEGLAMRGTFLIDPSGILRAMEINDSALPRSGAETLRKLEASQVKLRGRVSSTSI